ncbi:unnamed protein product [Protopolystoma xenopodis]|uniref:G-protein coupled receptors family 1 profile domain-containing protein n=1 Tax=Protopolystoma xenopodis TaxID=117903 RepID=A0A3S5C8N1_9PLAT|nr:unnamed protein product [Protopolystoma xenopodis]
MAPLVLRPLPTNLRFVASLVAANCLHVAVAMSQAFIGLVNEFSPRPPASFDPFVRARLLLDRLHFQSDSSSATTSELVSELTSESAIRPAYPARVPFLPAYSPCAHLLLDALLHTAYNATLLSLCGLSLDLYLGLVHPIFYPAWQSPQPQQQRIASLPTGSIAVLPTSPSLYWSRGSSSHSTGWLSSFACLRGNQMTMSSGSASRQLGQSQANRYRRGLVTTLILLVCFLFTFTPICLHYLADHLLLQKASFRLLRTLSDSLVVFISGQLALNMPLVNTVLSPILYAFRVPDIRRILKAWIHETANSTVFRVSTSWCQRPAASDRPSVPASEYGSGQLT